MIEKLEESLKGGYGGLYGEVVTEDCYRLQVLNFVPQVIFDLGCNIGIFSRYARSLFPDALIVSVEPHKENIEVFKQFTKDEKIILIEKAIGKGNLWHSMGAVNGSGESYVSSGIGFYDKEMTDENARENTHIQRSEIPTVLPDELINTYVKGSEKFLVKIDIEGGEHAIFSDESSMKALAKADYICMELHLYALQGGEMYETMAIKLGESIGRLMMTHSVSLHNVHLWATKNNF